jgi:glycosyltransferase involved in cell wall biosynthesis
MGELRPPQWWKETEQKYNVGNHPETRDKKEWISIDDEFNYNEEHLNKMLTSLKNNDETITILMPAYNEEKNIKLSIESVLNQTHQNFKIIVLDDNSTDNTIDTIRSLEDPRITIYKNKVNRGRGYNRNKLMELSTTKLSCWLDADDKMLPEKLEKQLSYFKKNNECTFLATRMFDANKNGEIIGEGSNKKEMVDSLTEKTILSHNPINNPTVMFLTEIGRNLKYKEEMKAEEDWDFWKRLYKSGNKVDCLDDLLLIYTINNHTT